MNVCLWGDIQIHSHTIFFRFFLSKLTIQLQTHTISFTHVAIMDFFFISSGYCRRIFATLFYSMKKLKKKKRFLPEFASDVVSSRIRSTIVANSSTYFSDLQ